MKVILKSDLFTPFGRFKKTENSRYPSELPEEVRPHLPKTAIVVEENKREPLPVPARPEPEPEPEPTTFTEINKASKGVTALEHFTKKK